MMNFLIKICRYVITILVVVLTMFVSARAQAATRTRFVDDNAALGGNGQSWTTAYRYLQDAIKDVGDFVDENSQVNEGVVWVAQGDYRPDQAETYTIQLNSRNVSFELHNKVRLYGGFLGNEPNDQPGFLSRAPLTRPTILTGAIGNPNTITDNSYHVVKGLGVNASCIIDGFTVRHGYAVSGSESGQYLMEGAGMLLVGNVDSLPNINPYVIRCRFEFNTGVRGAAVFVQGTQSSNPYFYNCRFITNLGTTLDSDHLGVGSAIYVANKTYVSGQIHAFANRPDVLGTLNGPNPSFWNCDLHFNLGAFAGTVFCENLGTPNLSNCTIANNTTTSEGSAVYHVSGDTCLTPTSKDGAARSNYTIVWGNSVPGNPTQPSSRATTDSTAATSRI